MPQVVHEAGELHAEHVVVRDLQLGLLDAQVLEKRSREVGDADRVLLRGAGGRRRGHGWRRARARQERAARQRQPAEKCSGPRRRRGRTLSSRGRLAGVLCRRVDKVAAAELLDLIEPLEVGRVHHRDEQRRQRHRAVHAVMDTLVLLARGTASDGPPPLPPPQSSAAFALLLRFLFTVSCGRGVGLSVTLICELLIGSSTRFAKACVLSSSSSDGGGACSACGD